MPMPSWLYQGMPYLISSINPQLSRIGRSSVISAGRCCDHAM